MIDLAVIGAGPAGCAAAIWAAAHGLDVLLVERSHFPRHRPGECLHPGIEVMLRSLGVADEVLERCTARPPTRTVVVAGRRSSESFGTDSGGEWRALHISRAELDSILLNRARELGIAPHIGRCSIAPIVRGQTFEGVEIDGRPYPCSFVIDATGQAGWLTRSLGLKHFALSPRLTAFYGYCEGHLAGEQLFEADAVGWRWIAQVSPGLLNWTSLGFGVHRRPNAPASLSSLPPCEKAGGADVTWRIAPSLAGPSHFVVGDAAFVTDPASGNGVLRAVMSGIKAAHNARAVLAGEASRAAAARDYDSWIRGWFEADTTRLADLYSALRADWREAESPRHRSPEAGPTRPAPATFHFPSSAGDDRVQDTHPQYSQ